MVPSERTVTIAVGHGKKAARNSSTATCASEPYRKPEKHPVVGFERLHVWFNTEAPQRRQPAQLVEQRTNSFGEIIGGLTEKEARYEAQRCLSCGNCFECDGCYGSCPEDAIIKLGPGKRYRYNYDPLHRLRRLLRAVPLPRHRNDSRACNRGAHNADSSGSPGAAAVPSPPAVFPFFSRPLQFAMTLRLIFSPCNE
jgi:ferredoxin